MVVDDIVEELILTSAFFAGDEDAPVVAGVVFNEETPAGVLDETTGLFELLDDFPPIAVYQPMVKNNVIFIL